MRQRDTVSERELVSSRDLRCRGAAPRVSSIAIDEPEAGQPDASVDPYDAMPLSFPTTLCDPDSPEENRRGICVTTVPLP